MKKIGLLLVAMSAVMTLVSTTVSAQENGNRDENNKIVRGPYETNGFGGNWFIGIGGGINTFVDGGYSPRIGPSLDVNVGKWFTPSIGARVGYSGLNFSEWANKPSILGPELDADKNKYKRTEGFAYVHADVMWNISNAFSGYKETRFWDVIPYIHGGVFRGYGAKGIKYGNNEFAAGAGIYNTMRISNRVKLSLDLRGTVVSGNIHEAQGSLSGLAQLTFGVVVNLGKTNWKRATTVPAGFGVYNVKNIEALNDNAEHLKNANNKLEKQNSDLNQANKGLEKKNSDLTRTNDELKKENEALKGNTAGNNLSSAMLFFKIGKTTLDEKELLHLDFYVTSVLRQDENKVFKITAYADQSTGSKERNQYLVKNRAQYVHDLLRNKYNIPENRLTIVESDEMNDKFESPVFSRSVVLE